MRHLALVSIALTGFLCSVSPAFGGSSICGLPAASDVFNDSEGAGMMPVPGILGLLPFAVCGPTTITRGTPVDPDPPGGTCTIPTEIVSMTLTGVFDPCGLGPGPLPITIIEDPGIASTGSITSDASGGLPGSSFFDVYTLVTIPGFGTFPHFAHVDEPVLDAVPPGGPGCVMPGDDVYAAGFPAHNHIPCPPKLCCQLECGVRLHVSLQDCQLLGGTPSPEHCGPLCPGNVAVKPGTWGSVKHFYLK